MNLLIGNRVTTFGADAFGGTVGGKLEDSESERNIALELDSLDLSEAPFVSDAIGLPAFGKLSGAIELNAPEARLSKAEGNISLKIVELGVGDGKAKIRDTIALPRIDAGDLVLEARDDERGDAHQGIRQTGDEQDAQPRAEGPGGHRPEVDPGARAEAGDLERREHQHG